MQPFSVLVTVVHVHRYNSCASMLNIRLVVSNWSLVSKMLIRWGLLGVSFVECSDRCARLWHDGKRSFMAKLGRYYMSSLFIFKLSLGCLLYEAIASFWEGMMLGMRWHHLSFSSDVIYHPFSLNTFKSPLSSCSVIRCYLGDIKALLVCRSRSRWMFDLIVFVCVVWLFILHGVSHRLTILVMSL